ncbi:hypothetical protein [Variovorax guangxiensis]|uniref:hypothetical protein n=1 Tax=Variovorax guangxiensis TaxID=1775474 RepID=UPI002858B4DD|nr:hypothetical protein [Variovorax guangxiensis]MDR6859833.1 hypothetical protein [Variovorax guangxiensis]
MWDGVTYVEPSHDPIIHEGEDSATVVVTNAGPATVRVRIWKSTPPEQTEKAQLELELRIGNTRSVSGHLIRAAIAKGDQVPALFPGVPFATLLWRVVR